LRQQCCANDLECKLKRLHAVHSVDAFHGVVGEAADLVSAQPIFSGATRLPQAHDDIGSAALKRA